MSSSHLLKPENLTSELMVLGALGGIGATFLTVGTAYYAYGSAGVGTVAGTAAAIGTLVASSRIISRQKGMHAVTGELEARERWVTTFDSSVQHVVRTLSDPWLACALWTSVGLGREPQPARGDLGAWPELEPSRDAVPADAGVWPRPIGAEIRLRMVPGQSPKDFANKLEHLAVALDVDEVKLLDHAGRLLCLQLRTRDPLATPIPVPMPVAGVDLQHLEVGMREDGENWAAPLLYRNTLGVGVPGSGKSGYIRSSLIACAPAAAEGLVVNLMIDCKFGIEAAAARNLIHEVAGNVKAAKKMLQWLREEIVETRGQYMEANGVDKHRPTVDQPMYHLIIDEIAELLDDPDLRGELIKLLSSILRLGRALGVSVSAYTQTPNKKSLDLLRDLFQIRVGMRMASPEQVVMTFGDHSAVERGAGCAKLADVGTEGIGFVADEGGRQIVRVRAYMATRDDLDRVAAAFPPYPHHLGLDEFVPEGEEEGGSRTKKSVRRTGKSINYVQTAAAPEVPDALWAKHMAYDEPAGPVQVTPQAADVGSDPVDGSDEIAGEDVPDNVTNLPARTNGYGLDDISGFISSLERP